MDNLSITKWMIAIYCKKPRKMQNGKAPHLFLFSHILPQIHWSKFDASVAKVINYWFLCFQKHPREVFCKKCCLRNFAKFTAKHLCHRLFSNKVASLSLATESLTQVNSREFCKISKSNFFTEHLLTTASVLCCLRWGKSGKLYLAVVLPLFICKSPLISWDIINLRRSLFDRRLFRIILHWRIHQADSDLPCQP